MAEATTQAHPRGIHFDPRFNWSHVVGTVTLAILLAGNWMAMSSRQDKAEGRADKIEASMEFLEARQDSTDAAILRQRQEVTTQIQNLRTELRTDLRDISGKLDRVLERSSESN